jgi:hypothetical protein
VQARPARRRHRPFLSLALLLLPLTHPRLFCALHYRTFSDTPQSLFFIFYTLAVADLTTRSLHFVFCSLTPVTTATSNTMSYGGGGYGGGRDGGGGGYGYEHSKTGSGAYNNYDYSSQYKSYG